MNKIAKKILISAIIGGLFVFAVNLGVCDMSNASANMVESIESVPTNKLDSQEFWNKFRESIMKDRKENDPDNPPQTAEHNSDDDSSSEVERHSMS